MSEVVTTLHTADYLGRALITPQSDAQDHMGRRCLAGGVTAGDETDYEGRALITVAFPYMIPCTIPFRTP